MARIWARATRNTDTPLVNGVHCLDWQGACNSDGYPVIWWQGAVVLVTRLVLAVCVRKFRRREEACHDCDRPRCIEPLHLEHGTKAKNMRDMWSRKRRYRPCTFMAD